MEVVNNKWGHPKQHEKEKREEENCPNNPQIL
jgi:hypothetical protein